jgi:methylmalonyl-CoA carboxyltransferase large subunit
MKAETVDGAEMTETLRAFRQELARLSERVAALEVASGARSQPAPTPPAVRPEAVGEDIILVISAAIAAFLGKKPRIRQIRLLSTPAWAQQGRVTIQASHALAARHARNEH